MLKKLAKKTGKVIKFILFGIVAIMAIMLLPLTACKADPQKRYEREWSIELPENMVVEYEANYSSGFRGDLLRYTVFRLEKEPTAFISDFSKGSSQPFEIAQSKLDISDNFLPKWDEENYRKTISRDNFHNLFMIYFTNDLKLILYQDIRN